MSIKLRLSIVFGTIVFFVLLGSSIVEFVKYEMYFEPGRLLVLGLILGGSTALFIATGFLKKMQSGLDRFRILALSLIIGIFTGPGLFGLINGLGASVNRDYVFTFNSSLPIIHGEAMFSPVETDAMYCAVILESSSGFLRFKLENTEELRSLKQGDLVKMTIMEGLLGFDYFSASSFQKI